MNIPINLETLPNPPSYIYELNIKKKQTSKLQTKGSENDNDNLIGTTTPKHGRNNFLTQIGGKLRRAGFDFYLIKTALVSVNNQKCTPPLSDSEVNTIANSVSRYEPKEKLFDEKSSFEVTSLARLLDDNKSLNRPVIEGLIRRGEVMNVIAAPKVGKSWLVMALAMAVAHDETFLSYFKSIPGRVLVIDNELHKTTLASRYRLLLEAREVLPEEVSNIDFISLRGSLRDINSISQYLLSLEPDKYSMIIFDAWYRVLPNDVDENDNGAITKLYNQLDMLAFQTNVAIVLVHHASKGNQSSKSVTDMGSGAGSQSRAADTHLVLKKHKMENTAVLEAVTRSWKAPPPMVIKLDFPKWVLVKDGDVTDLDTGRPQKTKPEKETWTREKFINQFFTNDQIDHDVVFDEAVEAGVPKTQMVQFIKAALKCKRLYSAKVDKDTIYSLSPIELQSSEEQQKGLSKSERVKRLLEKEPDLTATQIAERCDCTPQYARNVQKKIKETVSSSFS